MTLRRYAPIAKSRGTTWPPAVREHVRSHYEGCIGPLAGMPGACDGPLDLDHIRSSGTFGRKSKSIATNAAPLCRFSHHRMKTDHGREWRPRLLVVVAGLTRGCASCDAEYRERLA